MKRLCTHRDQVMKSAHHKASALWCFKAAVHPSTAALTQCVRVSQRAGHPKSCSVNMNAFVCNSKWAPHGLVRYMSEPRRGIFNVKNDFCIIFISVPKTLKSVSVKTGLSSATTNVHACCFMLNCPHLNHLWHLYCCLIRLFCFKCWSVSITVSEMKNCVSTCITWQNVGVCVCMRVCLRITLIKCEIFFLTSPVHWCAFAVKSENRHASCW